MINKLKKQAHEDLLRAFKKKGKVLDPSFTVVENLLDKYIEEAFNARYEEIAKGTIIDQGKFNVILNERGIEHWCNDEIIHVVTKDGLVMNKQVNPEEFKKYKKKYENSK